MSTKISHRRTYAGDGITCSYVIQSDNRDALAALSETIGVSRSAILNYLIEQMRDRKRLPTISQILRSPTT